MTRDQYLTFLRIAAFITAIGLWLVSVYFSADGFGIEVPSVAWIGIVLALSVTVIELVFNRDGVHHNYTLILTGLAAYAYGIYTNIIGILAAQGNNMSFSGAVIFPVILALFLEIVPEPLMLWALMGVNFDDLLSKMFSKQESSGLHIPLSSHRIPPPPGLFSQDNLRFEPRNLAERKHPNPLIRK